MNGGSNVIPPHKQQKNNPSVSNLQKEIRKKKYQEPVISTNTPLGKLVDFQLYQPQQKQKAPEPVNILPMSTMNPYIPQQLYGYPSFPHNYLPPPIIQKYNINMAGPSGDHLKMNMIYEDILPTKQFEIAYTTLSNRLNIAQFIKSTFVKKNEGEEISIDDKGKHSLLQYVKFMELNPYHNSRFTHNPYNGLPNGLLIYKTCYPIQFDNLSNSITCAKDSMSMTVKIFNLTPEASLNYIQDGSNKYDEWRELLFYKYVREQILEKKICPHFVLLYSYFINPKSSVDFNKVSMINKYNPVKTSGNAIITLSEAPNYNILNWSVKSYLQNGNIRQMIETGYHSDDVWGSILFQIMVGILLLQKNNILINNFSIKNIYIKDLNITGPVTNYWKYIIDDIGYYIPNYGYIVLIDSNYDDKKTSQTYKIQASFMNDPVTNENTFEMFKNVINPSVFTSEFSAEGCVLPSNYIVNFIASIHNATLSDTQKLIKNYFPKFMGKYVNNRIGTVLKDSEIRYIRENNISNISKGQIVVHEISYDLYKFVMFIGVENNLIKVITRKENEKGIILDDNITEYLPMGSIYNYCMYEPITQNYDMTKTNMKESEMLEVYVIN